MCAPAVSYPLTRSLVRAARQLQRVPHPSRGGSHCSSPAHLLVSLWRPGSPRRTSRALLSRSAPAPPRRKARSHPPSQRERHLHAHLRLEAPELDPGGSPPVDPAPERGSAVFSNLLSSSPKRPETPSPLAPEPTSPLRLTDTAWGPAGGLYQRSRHPSSRPAFSSALYAK